MITNNDNKNLLPHGVKNTGYSRLNDYKFEVIDLLLKNQELLKLLKYPNSDPWSMEDVTEEEKDSFIHKYIFPYPKNPNFNGEAKASIYVDFATGKIKGNDFKGLLLTIDIVIEEACNKTINGTRDIIIMDIIDKELNKSRGLGLGQLQSQGFSRIILNNQVAYRLGYLVTDFN